MIGFFENNFWQSYLYGTNNHYNDYYITITLNKETIAAFCRLQEELSLGFKVENSRVLCCS